MLTLREKHEYEHEIAQLKTELLATSKSLAKVTKSRHNLQYRFNTLNSTVYKERGLRTVEARELIRLKGINAIKITLKEIAKKTNLAYTSIINISSEYNLKQASQK